MSGHPADHQRLIDEHCKPEIPLKEGDRVYISKGPLRGLEGEVRGLNHHNTAAVVKFRDVTREIQTDALKTFNKPPEFLDENTKKIKEEGKTYEEAMSEHSDVVQRDMKHSPEFAYLVGVKEGLRIALNDVRKNTSGRILYNFGPRVGEMK